MSGFQVMPRLSADEYSDLEADIVAHGVQVPITVSHDGVIVDGHHRDEIARKHDLHCPRVTATGTESELRGLAFSLNLNRRHLNREQRRELIAESLRSDPQLSNREHARRTGANHETVGSVRKEMVGSGALAEIANATTSDGRTYPVTRPAYQAECPRATFIPQSDLDALNTAPDALEDKTPHWEPAGQMTPTAVRSITPEKPKRRALTDEVWDIVLDLKKTLNRLDRTTTDDRFAQKKAQIAELASNDLSLIEKTIAGYRNNLTH